MKVGGINAHLLGIGIAAAMTLAAPVRADTVVIPAAAIGIELPQADSSPLGNAADSYEWRFQMVYGSGLLGGLQIGDIITGLTFRIDVQSRDGAGHNTSLPAQTVYFQIGMGSFAAGPGNLDSIFANNRAGDYLVVRDSNLVIGATDFPGGAVGGPNPFGAMIDFTSDFTYNGGPLLIEIAHQGFPEGGRYADDSAHGQFPDQGEQLFADSFGATEATWESEPQVMAIMLEYTRPDGPGGNVVPAPSGLSLFGAAFACMMGVALVGRRRQLIPAKIKA